MGIVYLSWAWKRQRLLPLQLVGDGEKFGAVCDVRSLVNDFAAATNGAARPVLAQMWQRRPRQGRAQFRRRCARASPVPVQMCQGRAQSRCRCGKGELRAVTSMPQNSRTRQIVSPMIVERRWPTCMSLAMFGDEKSTRHLRLSTVGTGCRTI